MTHFKKRVKGEKKAKCIITKTAVKQNGPLITYRKKKKAQGRKVVKKGHGGNARKEKEKWEVVWSRMVMFRPSQLSK